MGKRDFNNNTNQYMGQYKKKKKTKRRGEGMPRCPVCGSTSKIIDRSEMNMKRDYNDGVERFLVCSRYPECDTYVKLTPGTGKPAGTMAGPYLRFLRTVLHQLADSFVRSGAYTKDGFWAMCMSIMHVDYRDDFHVRTMSSEYQMEQLIDTLLVTAMSNRQIVTPAATEYLYSTALFRYIDSKGLSENFATLAKENGKYLKNRQEQEN